MLRSGIFVSARRAAIVAALLAVLLAGMTFFSGGSASAQDYDPGVPNPTVSAEDGSRLAQMVNEYRVANGLNALVHDPGFSARTEPFASYLMSLNPTGPTPAGYLFWCPTTSPSTFFHDSGASLLASAPAAGAPVSENIGFVCEGRFANHAGVIMNGWKNSPGHNTTMLKPDWTHIASVAVRWNNTTIAVQRFSAVPGTAAPAVAQTPTATATPIPAPTATPLPEPTATVTPEPTVAPDPTVLPDPTATPISDDATTGRTDTTESASGNITAAAASSGPIELAFTGTNLNLALVGLLLIGGGVFLVAFGRRAEQGERLTD